MALGPFGWMAGKALKSYCYGCS